MTFVTSIMSMEHALSVNFIPSNTKELLRCDVSDIKSRVLKLCVTIMSKVVTEFLLHVM
jgi:hypothetical protein